MMKKPAGTTTLFVKSLTFGDRFVLPEQRTVYVAHQVTTVDNYTRVVYRVEGDSSQHEFVKTNMSTVYRFED